MSNRKRKSNYGASREKVLVLEAQVRAILEGELTEFHCPFCDLVTAQDQMLCCPEAGEVISAILDHVDHLERIAIVEQVMDSFSAAESAHSRVTLN